MILSQPSLNHGNYRHGDFMVDLGKFDFDNQRGNGQFQSDEFL